MPIEWGVGWPHRLFLHTLDPKLTFTAHAKKPSCVSTQEGFFVFGRSVFSLAQPGEQLGRHFLAVGGELVGAERVHLTLGQETARCEVPLALAGPFGPSGVSGLYP